MKTLKDKILDKIEKGDIEQKSKLYFKIKNIIAWTATVVSLFLSSFFTAGIVFVLINHILIPPPIIILFIFIDLILFAVLMYLAYRHFQMIKNSYRIHLRAVFIVAFLGVSLLSFVFVQSRFYGNIDSAVKRFNPQLSLQGNIHENWSEPSITGKLAGEVVNIEESGIISIKDFSGEIHSVDPVLLNDREKDIFLEYLRVRMHGIVESDIYYPDRVDPWEFRQGPKKYHEEYKKPFKRENIYFPLNKK